MTSAFVRLGVPASLSDVLAGRDITDPTPIQAATLPDSLAGRDVLGRGRTGSGKTYAFLLPLVARLTAAPRAARPKRPRALVLAPTRELATQIEEALKPLEAASGLKSRTIFGGVGQGPQVKALAQGVDVLVACPGRLLDLMGQGAISLDEVEITVLDEADHMADMGFLPMVRKILDRTPAKGQRLLFSATLDNGIDVLVKRYLHDPVTHEADSPQSPISTMDHYVLRVDNVTRNTVLADLASAPGRTIMFTRTKHGAKKLAKQLIDRGIPAVDLHGNLSQNARTRNLAAFESGTVETMVATDIAARGIHVDDVALVVHADPPIEHKAYLHRSGRTARAGNSGTVVTLVTSEQRNEVRQMMRKAGIKPAVHEAAEREVLNTLAPGERVVLSPDAARALAQPTVSQPQQPSRSRQGGARGAQTGGRGRRPLAEGAPRAAVGSRSGGARGGASARTVAAVRSGAAPRSAGSEAPRGGRGHRHAGRPGGAA
ncbi:Superfamily II DNA and RNA helicase [Raineyella antarctica]|uniref:Superfamily II DNA and RNA helicase n=1 Tax=Raineyella antarctica TaxID=1577474 RepID=A0A1G6GGS0_9ACTN|nr:DEAD/DEAH box helicase [Raineyella antarctica]SDB81232.1 Superfamily II DNA and RNA helicase [Raineyella antarctica]